MDNGKEKENKKLIRNKVKKKKGKKIIFYICINIK